MKSKNRNQSGAAAIVVATLAIAGCGGGGSSSTVASVTATNGTMTKEQAARTYLAAVATPNEVLRTFLGKAKGWTDSTPSTQQRGGETSCRSATSIAPRTRSVPLSAQLEHVAATLPASKVANDVDRRVVLSAVTVGKRGSVRRG
jgi:hypothetical protein